MRRTLAALTLSILPLALGQAWAQEEASLRIGSAWNGPVSTHLCAPVTACSSELDGLEPLLEHPILLADPALLQDTLSLLAYPSVVADPATLADLLAAQPDLLTDPDAVLALLEASPTLLQDLQAMPVAIEIVNAAGLDPASLPPDLPLLFGSLGIGNEAGQMALVTDAGGTRLLLGGGLGSGDADGAATAAVIVDSGLSNNQAIDDQTTRRSMIQDSFRANRGLINANQSSGNLNNQANVRVIAIGRGQATVPMAGLAGRFQGGGNSALSYGGVRENRLENSFGGTSGLVGLNQTAGNLNRQANLVALAVGIGLDPGAPVLGDSDLSALAADTSGQPRAKGERADVIYGSFGDFRGVAQVSQSSGDANAISNTLSVSMEILP